MQDTTTDTQPIWTATAMLDLLERSLHSARSEWLFLRELRVGTGHRNHSLQRLDAFALNCLPHLAMKRVCYELKVSRADFLCELRSPLKRRIGMRFSNEFSLSLPQECCLLMKFPPTAASFDLEHDAAIALLLSPLFGMPVGQTGLTQNIVLI